MIVLNGLSTKSKLNIMSLGTYDYLIGVDWLEKHHIILDCYNKSFTFVEDEGQQRHV